MTYIYEDTGEREVIRQQIVVENIFEKVTQNPSVITRQTTSDAMLPEIYI